ncbi:DUF2790 domain-containing protein [Pseudomonas sp. B14-6]|uniref:DUF2790 domain-containing protein n=1 Tax=Pseudomonas sp. B14-6 TaxID=2738843 RepID=UPI00155F0DB8|nr:DUF2790 domain-containing protein [Pseudomonas sp. B14-6]QKG67101.1 DUF2790 domain-containing protein [Pseudomonas sp. B14-6]
MKRLSIVGLLLSISLSGLTASFASASTDPELVPAIPYAYGMSLDVAKVLSIEKPHTNHCEIIQSKMTYLDYAGLQHAITYQLHSDNCFIGS